MSAVRTPGFFESEPPVRLVGIARLASLGESLDEGHKVEYFSLPAQSLLNKCDTPRMPFTWTINPAGGTGSGTCKVTYTPSQWTGGFVANLTITNTGTTAINGWNLTFTFPGDQKITNAWNSTASQTGQNVTVTNASWNAALAPGASVSPGFQGTWSSSDATPTAFSLNGSACAVS